jgi:hypothetical protein
MPFTALPRLLVASAVLLPATLLAQTIHRCEGPEGRVSYSDKECPPGSRAVRAMAPPAAPTAEDQKEARARAQREKDVAAALAQSRQATPASPRGGAAYVPAEEARRAADCAYLRAELDSSRRLRNVLTTRPYYSLDDVEQMDAREAALAADYRRYCSR